jgi:hypothetical protein
MSMVTEIGRLVFEVRGSKSDEWRQVDLCEHNGAGRCSCFHWSKFIGPAIQNLKPDFKKVENRMDEKFMCHHIKIVRHYVSDRLVQQVIEQFPDNEQTT